MRTVDKFLSILAAVLIVLVFVLKSPIAQKYRFGLGARFYRPDSIALWPLIAVFILGTIIVINILMRNTAI
jgi:hypothetical protein